MKKILVASDSFKGTLSSKEIIFLCQKVIKEHQIEAEILPFSVADGGEGSLEAFSSCLSGKMISKKVKDANGELIEASYLFFNQEAIIEVASVIGLPHTKFQNPLFTSSFGVGELILDAISKGAKRIYVALGGSSTNDGGAPILSCLGAKFLDSDGNSILDLCNHNLPLISSIDLEGLKKKMKGIEFIGICDVNNPLLGPRGASYVYALQKGAKKEDLPILESNLSHYANKLIESTNIDESNLSGSGAAGGIGFGLTMGLSAKLESGIDVILDLSRIEKAIEESDIILSGEGRLDEQSFQGKVVDGLLKRCKKKGKNLSLIVGSMQKELSLPKGIDYVGCTSQNREDFEDIKKHAKEDYEEAFIDFLKAKKFF